MQELKDKDESYTTLHSGCASLGHCTHELTAVVVICTHLVTITAGSTKGTQWDTHMHTCVHTHTM